MGDGSHWYFPVYEGLYDGKHMQAMGSAIWLYGWMLARAFISKEPGTLVYQHVEAAGCAAGRRVVPAVYV